MRKRPFLSMACFFLLGIVWKLNGTIIIPIGMVAALVYCVNRLRKTKKWWRLIGRSVMLLSLFLLGYLRMTQELDFRQAYMRKWVDGDTITIQGEIYKKEFKNQQYLYYLKDCYTVGSNCKAQTNFVIAYFKEDDGSIGQKLIINGKVKQFQEARNEGNFDLKKYYQSQKIDYGVTSATIVSSSEKTKSIKEYLYRLRERLKNVYLSYLSKEDAGVLAVMLLGDKTSLDTEVRSLYQNAGISHILAISGLHVSLLGLGLYQLLRKCRCRIRTATILASAFLLSYGIMTGMGVSTQRAIGMFLLSMLGLWVERSNDLLNGLGLMGFFLLYQNPFLIGYSGFIFSFMAIIGVGVVGKQLSQLLGEVRHKEQKEQQKGKFKNTILVSIGIQLTTLPLVAYYYYEVPVYAILVNLVVLPPLKIVLLSGIVGGLSGLFVSGVPGIFLLPAKLVLKVYAAICVVCMQLPYAQFITGQPSRIQLTIYYMVLSAGVYAIYWRNQKRKRGRWEKKEEAETAGKMKQKFLKEKSGVAIWIIALACILLFKQHSGFELDVLDVGQGDGIYLRTQDGVDIFFDGGSTDVKEVGTYRIVPFLKSKGVPYISYWFISHGDEDHISGVVEAIEGGYEVHNLVLSEYMPKDDSYHKLLQLASEHNVGIIKLKAGDYITTDTTKFTCVYPDKRRAENMTDRNKLSQVILYEDELFAGLFAGDLDETGEAYICSNYKLPKVNYLKAIHHGANTSNSKVLLETVKPDLVTISCALKNSYGHPGKDAVLRMEESGTQIYETMLQGEIIVTWESVHGHIMEQKDK